MKVKTAGKNGFVFFLILVFFISFVSCNKKQTSNINEDDNIFRNTEKKEPLKGYDSTEVTIHNNTNGNSAPIFTEEKMKNVTTVGGWTYFIYDLTEPYDSSELTYPVLYRRKKEEAPIRVTLGSCYRYEILNDKVYYMNTQKDFRDHGILYVMNPDGSDMRILEEELYNFQIINDKFIYYVFRHDTYGVGIEGHSLHRMNLDGTNKMIAAYQARGFGFGCSQRELTVEGDWVYGNKYRMRLGAPATGLEKVELLTDIEDNGDEWIYYVTNQLLKARKDGSEQIALDEIDDYRYQVNNVEGDWIFYNKGDTKYKIKKDGTEKTRIKD